MKKGKNKPYQITGARKLASLTSPVRQEILDAMHALGPGTVAEIAEALNRAPDSLYYHLKILLAVGLVLETGVRTGGPRPEAVYDLPGRPMTIKYSQAPKTRRAIAKTVSGMLRLTDRDFQTAVENHKTSFNGENPVLNGARLKAWLNRDQIDRIKEHLADIEQIMSNGRKEPDTELVAFTRLLIPMSDTRRPRSPKPKKDN